MLTIEVTNHEFYDSQKELFFYTKAQVVRLEHSLISIAKWEAHWKKPYLPGRGVPGLQGHAEELHYVSCMIIGNVSDHIPGLLLQHHSLEIQEYITDAHTASTSYTIGDTPVTRHIVTAELIYYWMIKFGVPFECDRWHFNRLLTLINVCNTKDNADKNTMSPTEAARHRHKLNLARKAK